MAQSPKKVGLDSKVLLKVDGEEGEYTLVYPKDADVLKFKISTESPVGRAILGKKAGEEVLIELRKTKLKCKILKVK